MKIILLGYMGSGKTTIGKILAERRKLPFIDLDHYIEEKEQMPISEIFNQKGEIYFRKKESDYLKELLESDKNFVLSLGGGTPCYGNNMLLISKSSENVFYLRCTPQSLTKRLLPEKKSRPLISKLKDEDLEEFIRKHLFERNPYYTKAKHTIIIDDISLEESLQLIAEKISV